MHFSFQGDFSTYSNSIFFLVQGMSYFNIPLPCAMNLVPSFVVNSIDVKLPKKLVKPKFKYRRIHSPILWMMQYSKQSAFSNSLSTQQKGKISMWQYHCTGNIKDHITLTISQPLGCLSVEFFYSLHICLIIAFVYGEVKIYCHKFCCIFWEAFHTQIFHYIGFSAYYIILSVLGDLQCSVLPLLSGNDVAVINISTSAQLCFRMSEVKPFIYLFLKIIFQVQVFACSLSLSCSSFQTKVRLQDRRHIRGKKIIIQVHGQVT